MAFLLRSAVLADLAVLRDIFVRASLSNPGDREVLLAHPDALLLADTGVREGRTRVATTPGGRIVGFATWAPASLPDEVEVEDLFVDPEWMRRGAARELVLDLAATATQQGKARLTVTANAEALGFYKKVGFVVDGEAPTRFGPASHMHLDLRRRDPD